MPMKGPALVIERTYVPDPKRATQAIITLLTVKRKPAEIMVPAGDISQGEAAARLPSPAAIVESSPQQKISEESRGDCSTAEAGGARWP
jgi:hypothetical protein